jgi:hypothetical protein
VLISGQSLCGDAMLKRIEFRAKPEDQIRTDLKRIVETIGNGKHIKCMLPYEFDAQMGKWI